MNRKQKIIISVTGIFIVMLILVGLTYAYFLTQITGNTKDKSISVTTANLVVRYEDGTNIILDENTKLKPSSNAIGTKTFDVVNEGDEADYVVIVDNISIKNATTGESTTFKTNDFVYTLECTSSDGNDCSDVKTQSTLPLKNESILIGNRMDSGVTHSYTLTLWYLDNGSDQSDDMNKTLDVRINIEDIRNLENPYKDNTNSLAYNIINNSLNKTNGTELMSAPLTKVAEEISLTYKTNEYANQIVTDEDGFYGWSVISYGDTAEAAINGENFVGDLGLDDYVAICNAVKNKHIYDISYIGKVEDCTADGTPIILKPINAYEQTLSPAQDDYGISYYYRGEVEDNYLTFADMCWRIVRIEGDGSTKIILEDRDQPCNKDINGNWDIPTTTGGTIYTGNYGYTKYSSTKYFIDYLHGQTESNKSMATAFRNFQGTFTESEISKLKSGNWCLGDYVYDENDNLLNATQIMDKKIKGEYFEYDSYRRIAYDNITPTLKCNGTKMNAWEDENNTQMYVGTITSDESLYAGGALFKTNKNYYLVNDYNKTVNKPFWLLSHLSYDGNSEQVFTIILGGTLNNNDIKENYSFRPAVSLKSGVEIISGGNGTKDNPYVIQ